MKIKVAASIATAVILSTSFTTNALASTYIVKKGDTLEAIAKKQNVAVKEIKTLNNLKSNALFVNQTLNLKPTTSAASQNNVSNPAAAQNTYTVIKGDNLTKIANIYKLTVSELKQWNSLPNDSLFVGQKLLVSKPTAIAPTKPVTVTPATPKETASSTSQDEYIVQSGDSLSKIASMFNTTIDQVKAKNGLTSDLIFVGQKLTITGGNAGPSENKAQDAQTSNNLLIKEGMALLGTPYLYAGSTPAAFDCSGFIYYVFNKAGISVNRLSSEGYYSRAFYVDTPQVGDLVFFADTYKPGISHMGIYIGDQQFIHAGPTNGVEIANLNEAYYKKHFDGFKRFY
ncbi:LysM peptidoglycan-binding domain-containing protein [Cytobacillus depressus]|uniref:LysM peptidoglycan-binding domain-containing protein n=1 Tax=Cytobacillus depressus TaxID=1602942 RepID=A0A6L3V7P6_9BACI|nr:peptidoglycan endopeptidase [Cytobacillus depressus]KAB2336740.1 LysM peptidoglycan-binding domain-containing protein [Cytobacillus depressus]